MKPKPKHLTFLIKQISTPASFSIIIFLLLIGQIINAQTINAVLLNKNDSTTLAFASVKLNATGQTTTSNEKGEFSFNYTSTTELHIEISYVGCHITTTFKPEYKKINFIFADCPATTLKDVVVEGLTAKEIIKRAVIAIPQNYADSSFASSGFYRQYQKTNGKFKNLLEAQGIIMYNLSVNSKEILAKESFASKQLRRSNYNKTEDFEMDDFSGFMKQDPIYHLQNSMLDLRALDLYTFHFDTNATNENYVINYNCKSFTTDNHGIGNYASANVQEEGWETGKFVIDKKTFAFIRIERNAFRDKGYNYPKYNNFVLPSLKFTEELVEGHLILNYSNDNGKWHLKSMFHSYTNDFFRTQIYQHAYNITDCFEWYADTTTKYIDNELLDKFYFEPKLYTSNYTYEKDKWNMAIPPFYFYDKTLILKDLEKTTTLEQQFSNNGK